MLDEEKLLEERLKNLEQKYKQGLFEDEKEPEVIQAKKPKTIKKPIAKPTIPKLLKKRTMPVIKKPVKKLKTTNIKSKILKPVAKTKISKPVVAETISSGISGVKKWAPGSTERPSEADIKKSAEVIQRIKKEMAKVVIGQERIVDGLIMGLLCNAHILVEGVPGIAKTLAIRALAASSGCSVKRIQFTVDMLPTDIIGLTNYTPEKGFEIIQGPIFANFVIADEINRAPPKTQSALIEGMQEKQVTIGRKKFHLPLPFFVMATINPIENAGVYPLPEAQIDRFLLKLIMSYPKTEVEKKVMETNISLRKFEEFGLKPVTSAKEIMQMQEIVKKVYLDDKIKNYILAIVRKTRERDFENAEFISYGSSPRASIGLFIAGKARALMQGRNYVLPEDVKYVVFDVMRHRLILSYKATIQKISPDLIIKEILNSVKVE